MEETILVRRMKTGDQSAFDALYQLYAKPLLRTVYLIVGNVSDAEDIVQETFVKVFLHAGELKKEEGFRSWLYQIATRGAWEFGKKKSRELADEEVEAKQDALQVQDGFSSKDGDLDHRLILQEENQTLWQAVQCLEKKQRTVVILYYYNEFSTGEIAKITETLEGTVKSRLFHARKNLKKELEQTENRINLKGGLEYGKI